MLGFPVPITTTLRVRIPLRRGVLDTTLYDKVCQRLTAGQWFSSGTPVSSTNKTDSHDITEILLKVVLNTITYPPIHTPTQDQAFNDLFIIFVGALRTQKIRYSSTLL